MTGNCQLFENQTLIARSRAPSPVRKHALTEFGAPWIVRRKTVRWMLVFCVGVLLSMFYIVFDTWPFERFLLPALPLLYVATAAVVIHAVARLSPAARTVTLIVAVAMLLTRHIAVAQRLHIFNINRAEQRYATVGRFVGCAVPSRAVFLATLHSGSVRMYGNRLTVRWEALPHDALDGTVAMLRAAGYAPYFLLEEGEEPLFRQLFSGNALGQLDWPPMFEYQTARVRVYRADDRARYLGGHQIQTIPKGADTSIDRCSAADN
jgi:hypothetical protein